MSDLVHIHHSRRLDCLISRGSLIQSAELAHLPRHALPCPFPVPHGVVPLLLVLHRQTISVQSQYIHELRYFAMVSRRLHPVAPGDLLLLHGVTALLRAGLPAARFLSLRLSQGLPLLLVWRCNGCNEVTRLEQELSAHLSLVSALERQSSRYCLQPLGNASQCRSRKWSLDIVRLCSQIEGRVHSQRSKQRALRVGIDLELAVGVCDVLRDESWVATADDGDRGTQGQTE